MTNERGPTLRICRLINAGRIRCSAPAPLGLAGAVAFAAGCGGGLQGTDRRAMALLLQTTSNLGPDARVPRLSEPQDQHPSQPEDLSLTDEHPPTVNPPASAIHFQPSDEADRVMERLEAYARQAAAGRRMNLNEVLAYATEYSREYRFEEEEYVLAVLRLLIERHLWGPRLFNDLQATFVSIGDDGFFDSSLELVNDLRVTQRLPYGGEVSARLLAAATEDLHRRVASENIQTADLIFTADVPLLRGAGQVAREDLIQAERNVIYAARDFERFRRDFLFDISRVFLDLVVQSQGIMNSQRQVGLKEEFERRARALVDAGRTPPFEAALAEQDTLFARDRLSNLQEGNRLAVDRFKVRIGMPQEESLTIEISTPGLPTPRSDISAAVAVAMRYRLDLQNRRDELTDARRAIENARNALLADLDLSASIEIPTDDTKRRAGLDFDPENTAFRAGFILSLPLDREIERLNLRRSQIDFERAIREYERFRDIIAVEVRASVRNIDRARFSAELQEENVGIADRRLAEIEAAPERASALERSDAVDDQLLARDDYDRARRDLQIALLAYLLSTGQLRVDSSGFILPLQGMELAEPDQGGEGGPEAPPEARPDDNPPAPAAPDGGSIPAS